MLARLHGFPPKMGLHGFPPKMGMEMAESVFDEPFVRAVDQLLLRKTHALWDLMIARQGENAAVCSTAGERILIGRPETPRFATRLQLEAVLPFGLWWVCDLNSIGKPVCNAGALWVPRDLDLAAIDRDAFLLTLQRMRMILFSHCGPDVRDWMPDGRADLLLEVGVSVVMLLSRLMGGVAGLACGN